MDVIAVYCDTQVGLNMLHFLIDSYRAWATQQPHPIPMSQRGSGLGETVDNKLKMVDNWQWLMSSTLFDNNIAHGALASQAGS